MGFTQKQILASLEKSGRNKWNVRQMIALRKEGFLPPLTRKAQSRTNKPLYLWDESDINQIVDVYDLWDYCNGDRATLALVLWLKGYKVSLDLLRRTYLTLIEAYIQKLTHGKTDPYDILFEVGGIMAVWLDKLKYTPKLPDQLKNMRIEQMAILTEAVLGALAVPEQELVAADLESPLLDVSESQDASTDSEGDENIITQSQDVVAILRDIFTLSHLRDAIISTTPEQWNQAREDYQSICHFLSEIEKLSANGDTSVFDDNDDILRNLTIMGAIFLIAPLISTRYHGYGQYIDMAFEKIHEMLADPAIQEQILKKHLARRKIEADVEDIEKT